MLRFWPNKLGRPIKLLRQLAFEVETRAPIARYVDIFEVAFSLITSPPPLVLELELEPNH